MGLTGLMIDRLVRAAASRFSQQYGELGISKPALVALAALVADAPLRQARLAERIGVDKATLVGILNELEQADLARRAPDPSDRRAHAVTPTAKGTRLLVRAQELAASDDFFDALTPDERRTLDALLGKLLAVHAA